MTTITKTEKTYFLSWDGEFTETKDLKEALETFEEIVKIDKHVGTLSLYECSNVYFWDNDDNKWVYDKGMNRPIKKLKLLGESQIDNTKHGGIFDDYTQLKA